MIGEYFSPEGVTVRTGRSDTRGNCTLGEQSLSADGHGPFPPSRIGKPVQWQHIRGGYGSGTPDHGDGFAAELHRLPFSPAPGQGQYSTTSRLCQAEWEPTEKNKRKIRQRIC
jgi:hypothetical protein